MPTSRPKTTVDAIDMLKHDHDRVERAFKDFEKMDRQDAEACRRLIRLVCEELKMHSLLEEEVFYPALREAIGDEDMLNEAAVEHETASMLIEQLDNMGIDDPNYFATFTVLGEYVRHHVKEEAGRDVPRGEEGQGRPRRPRRAHARAQGRAGRRSSLISREAWSADRQAAVPA